jgi:hypothetical protein
MKPLTRTAAFIAPAETPKRDKGKPNQRTTRRHRSQCPYCLALGESGFLTYHRAVTNVRIAARCELKSGIASHKEPIMLKTSKIERLENLAKSILRRH